LQWNKAFEGAGFRDALRVEQMPDTATWDPSDLRYNVVRWVSSAQPPYGAIGQYTTNPRTGQILGADVTIEWYTGSATPILEELLSRNTTAYGQTAETTDLSGNALCTIADALKSGFLAGSTALEGAGRSPEELSLMHRQFLTYLVMHEVGHTLGLNHNMKGSQLWTPAQINDTALTHQWGLLGSVMDYPAVNIARDPKKQGDYYTTKEGPYDDWAIAFGYTPYADSSAEVAGTAALLSKSTDPKLAFGNDADDMRTPGKGMDPRANVDDLTSDAIGYAAERLQLLRSLVPGLVRHYSKPGQSWAELRVRFASLQAQRQQAIGAVSRYIGGVYVDRSFPEQHSATKPFTPVPLAQQKRAMQVLKQYVFAPDAWMADTALLPYLQPQRRGFNQNPYGDDYKATNAALAQQYNGALAHLLHPATLQRLTNSRLYGNRYSVADLLGDLDAAIFAADERGTVNVYRQNLQSEYVRLLLEVVTDRLNQYDAVAQAAALDAVQRIRVRQAAAPSPNAETRAHRASLVYLIRKALEAK
ncbi:MAG: Matrixin, partial [Chitinophagaceae bacterium]